jgi:hypothetical protein
VFSSRGRSMLELTNLVGSVNRHLLSPTIAEKRNNYTMRCDWHCHVLNLMTSSQSKPDETQFDRPRGETSLSNLPSPSRSSRTFAKHRIAHSSTVLIDSSDITGNAVLQLVALDALSSGLARECTNKFFVSVPLIAPFHM